MGVPPWLWKPPLSERGPPTGIAPRSSREAEAVPVMEPGGSVLRRDRGETGFGAWGGAVGVIDGYNHINNYGL